MWSLAEDILGAVCLLILFFALPFLGWMFS